MRGLVEGLLTRKAQGRLCRPNRRQQQQPAEGGGLRGAPEDDCEGGRSCGRAGRNRSSPLAGAGAAASSRAAEYDPVLDDDGYVPVLMSATMAAGNAVSLPKMSVPSFASVSSQMSQLGELTKPYLPGALTGEHPSRFHLQAVQEFYRYTDKQGRKFFDELDEDKDGRINVDDLKRAMRRNKLPESYAYSFMNRAKRHPLAWNIGWEEFRAVMGMKEASMLRTFNGMTLTMGGSIREKQCKESLCKLGIVPSDDNASAMMNYLGGDKEYITYGSFRNFLMLLPPEKELNDLEASLAWYEAATFVPLSPPVRKGASGKQLLIAAMAGGLASSTTTSLMHPLDTLKTQVQAAVGKITLADVKDRWSSLGPRGLYRGIFPASLGAFLAHGIRTGTYEAVSNILAPLQGTILNDVQIQGLASGVGTLLGTAVRIPQEVMKQRLQCGQYNNFPHAFSMVLKEDGPQGFFRGTAATLAREVPFYVIGMISYEQLKLAMVKLRRKESEGLAAWETLLVGAMSGAIAAVVTTPADVLKTRTMTGAVPKGMSALEAVRVLATKEGPLALFKGALPRAAWIAPLGAMNFAGYELAKRAMDVESVTATSQVVEEVDEVVESVAEGAATG